MLHADSWPLWYILTQLHTMLKNYPTTHSERWRNRRSHDLNLASFIRQGNSPVGHCSGTAWHIVSVLLLLLPSFMTTKCSGKCSLTHRGHLILRASCKIHKQCVVLSYLLYLWCGEQQSAKTGIYCSDRKEQYHITVSYHKHNNCFVIQWYLHV